MIVYFTLYLNRKNKNKLATKTFILQLRKDNQFKFKDIYPKYKILN